MFSSNAFPGPDMRRLRTGPRNIPSGPPHFTFGSVVVPLKNAPTNWSSSLVRLVLKGSDTGDTVHDVAILSPSMSTPVMPRAALVGTSRVTHPEVAVAM